MLTRERNGYTAAQVEAVLHAARRRLSFRYELYDKNGVFKANLSNVRGASVEYNALADIKRTAKFALLDAEGINFLTDRIKPYARLAMPGGYAEFALGLFMLTTAPRTLADSGRRRMRNVEAYDLAQILVDDAVTVRYTVAAGTNYITAVKALLDSSSGLTAQNLVATGKTLPAGRDWDPGTPKLTIINDLLRACVYHDLWFDENGTATAVPYVSPASKPAEYAYRNDADSVLFPEAEQGYDRWNVPNSWVLVVSESDMAVYRSEYTNTSDRSPTSTTNLGRTVVSYQTVDADSQASLDAMVIRKAFEDSQVYETVQLSTAIMPFHSHVDVLTLEYTDLGVSDRYEEVFWAFELKAGASMKHVIRRIVTV